MLQTPHRGFGSWQSSMVLGTGVSLFSYGSISPKTLLKYRTILTVKLEYEQPVAQFRFLILITH